MKKVACLLLVCVAVGSIGAAFITQNESLVGATLTQLKFEALPPPKSGDKPIIGAPPQFKVTKDTIEYLQKLQKDGKIIQVNGDGKIEIKAGK